MKYFPIILFSLLFSSCVVTIKWNEKPKQDKTFGEKIDKQLLKEVYNHWKFTDVTGGSSPSFTVVPDSTCKVTRRLLFDTK